MFVPLHDGVPLRFLKAPYVTYGLIVTCTLVYGVMALQPGEPARIAIAAGFGMIPSVLFGEASLPAGLPHAPALVTLFTNIFMHASLAHLIGNMLFLWVFGDNVEDAMGHRRFLAFFVICGLAGSLSHALINPQSEAPLIGASGAISGVIASYLMLHPQVRVFGLAFKYVPLRVPAVWALSAWILLQIASAFLSREGDVGWWAHLGGLAAGAALTPLFVHRGVRLFGRIAASPQPAGER